MTTEGRFNPSDHLIKLGTKDYLPVAWRIAWFRDVHPDGEIDTELVEHDAAQGRAVFKATVMYELALGADGGSASGYGSETVGDFGDYLEKAETKAVGRALAMLGFGTQFCDDFDEGGAVTDSPVQRSMQPARGTRPEGSMPAPAPAAPKTASAALRDKPDAATEAWALLYGMFDRETQRAELLDFVQGKFPDIVDGSGDRRRVVFGQLDPKEMAAFIADLRALQPAVRSARASSSALRGRGVVDELYVM